MMLFLFLASVLLFPAPQKNSVVFFFVFFCSGFFFFSAILFSPPVSLWIPVSVLIIVERLCKHTGTMLWNNKSQIWSLCFKQFIFWSTMEWTQRCLMRLLEVTMLSKEISGRTFDGGKEVYGLIPHNNNHHLTPLTSCSELSSLWVNRLCEFLSTAAV